MRKLIIALLLFVPSLATAQVFNQNQVIITPYGGPGFVVSTTTSGGSKLQATTTPYFASFFATLGTIKYASTTALSSANLSSGNCIQASTGGLLVSTAFPCGSGSGSVTQINTTFPILGGPITTTGTLTFGGLSTSSAAVIGNIPYFSGVNTFANVATGTISASGPLSVTASRYAIGGAAAFSIAQSGVATDGYLSSTDWNTFNNKIGWGQATSTAANQSVYTNALGKLVSVATSTPTVTAPITYSGTLGSFVGGTGGTFACATCLIANQTITLTGAVTGSGATAITTAFGTASANTVLANGTGATAVPTFVATSSLFTFPWSIANGGTNATSFTTSGNAVYYDGTRLVTAPTTAAVTTPYASTTAISSTGSAYFATGSGSVGIGTTSPFTTLNVNDSTNTSAALLVSGSKGVRIGMSGGTGGLIEGVDYTGVASYQPLFIGGSDVRFTNSGTEAMRITGGLVGVGTTTPAQTLSVGGSLFVGASAAGGTSGGLGVGLVNTAAGTLQTSGVITANNGSLIRSFDGTASVGMQLETGIPAIEIHGNANTPFIDIAKDAATDFDFRLQEVSGNNRFSVSASSTANILNLLGNGNVGIDNSSPARTLDVTGTIRSSSELQSTSIIGLRMVQGNYGDFFYNDGSNFYFLLTASGDQYGSFNSLRPLIINDVTGAVTIDNGGVGTNFGGAVAAGNSFTSTGSGGGFFAVDRTASGSAGFYRSDSINRLYDSTFGDVLSYNTSGLVGIGTSTPDAKLTVLSTGLTTGAATTHGSIEIVGNQDLNAGASLPNGLEFKAAQGGNGYGWKILNPDRGFGNAPLVFAYRNASATWTEGMTFAQTGFVGIGTTTPSQALQVAIVGTATGIQIGSSQKGHTSLLLNTSADTSGYSAIQSITTQGIAYGNLALNANGGNVGIAATTPQALLSLGTAISTIKVAAYDDGTGNALYGMGVNAGQLTFLAGGTVNGTPQMVLTSTGNIGIGTTTPASIFQVSAGASATTTVDFGAEAVTAHTCFNVRNTAGAATSFYFVGTTMVVEAKRCL